MMPANPAIRVPGSNASMRAPVDAASESAPSADRFATATESPGGDRGPCRETPHPAGSDDEDVTTPDRADLLLDRRKRDIRERASWPVAPRPRPTSRLKRNREETFERLGRACRMRGLHQRKPEADEGSDPRRRPPNRARPQRTSRGVPPARRSATRAPSGSAPAKRAGVVRTSDVALYPMAGLENEHAAGPLSVKCRSEPLALDGWDVTRMGHERDDRRRRRIRSRPTRPFGSLGDRARSTVTAGGLAVTRHRGHEQPVHRPLGGLEQVGRLGRVEPAPARRDRQLVMERRAEAEEALDRLAEGQPEPRRDGAVLGGRARTPPAGGAPLCRAASRRGTGGGSRRGRGPAPGREGAARR